MVNVIIFTPAKEQVEYLQSLAQKMQTSDVHIDVVHCFGNPELISCLDQYDVILARGITYHMLHAKYPDKQICHMGFDGMDILDALLCCKENYHPQKIGVCLKQDGLKPMLQGLSEMCCAKILQYDVVDEESAYEAVDACLRDGVDAIVAGGSISNICKARGIPCTYIHVRPSTLERAMEDALYAAQSINTQRTKTNMIRMILDDNDKAVLAVDETGKLLEANEQAYRIYQLAFIENWQGKPITKINPGLSYIGNPERPCQNGAETMITLNGEKYFVKYKLISGMLSGTGTLIITTKATSSRIAEKRPQQNLQRQGLTAKYTFRDIIAVSDELRKIVEIAKKFSLAQSNVLITGETGTGKEIFAHSIHAASGRMDQPFVAINCATLPDTLLESELFGYEPGAFSGASREGKAGLFELANHGTLFLDEIGEIPVALQVKLLRALQEKEIRRIGSVNVIPVDVRVIAATNVNIQEQIAAGCFRSDLLYRINALEIYIPPLRERPDDIIPLMECYLRIFSANMGKTAPKLTAEAQWILKGYAWPGNVRELRNICERLVVLCEGKRIDASSLDELHVFFEKRPQLSDSDRSLMRETPAMPGSGLSAADSRLLIPNRAGKTKKELAQELGVSRTTLWRMMKRQQELMEKKENNNQG